MNHRNNIFVAFLLAVIAVFAAPCLAGNNPYNLTGPTLFSLTTTSAPQTPFVTPQMNTMSAAFGSIYTVLNPASNYNFTGSISLGAATNIFGGTYTSTDSAAEITLVPASATGDTLDNFHLSFGTGIGIHENRSGAKNTLINGARMSGAGYDFLINEDATNATGAIISDSFLTSTAADAIEWNNPTTGNTPSGNQFYTAIGNIVSAGEFGLGMAGTQDWAWIGNHVVSSTQEGFHVEDGQRRGIIGFNSCAACAANGMQLIVPDVSGGNATADPVMIVGNSLAHSGSAGSSIGINVLNNENGSLNGNSISANLLNGFNSGIAAALTTQYIGGNAVENCTNALQTGANTVTAGKNISIGCTNLATVGSGSIVDEIDWTAAPTAILVHGDANAIGGVIKGFAGPVIGSHPGDGMAHNVVLFPLGTLLRGTLTVVFSDGTGGFLYSADVTWDGTTLHVSSGTTSSLNYDAGTFSSPTYVASSSNLDVQFTSSTAVSNGTFDVTFTGIYFQT